MYACSVKPERYGADHAEKNAAWMEHGHPVQLQWGTLGWYHHFAPQGSRDSKPAPSFYLRSQLTMCPTSLAASPRVPTAPRWVMLTRCSHSTHSPTLQQLSRQPYLHIQKTSRCPQKVKPFKLFKRSLGAYDLAYWHEIPQCHTPHTSAVSENGPV